MTESIYFENTAAPDLVELKGVSQSYDGGKTWTIDNVNWLVEQTKVGRFICLLGKSGCGKSTLLRYIAGLQKPTKGEILYFEKPVKPNVGMIFQRYSSFPWRTVIDNVAFGLELRGVAESERYDKANEMVKLVGLDGQQMKYAEYPTLSGGQLQRVAIARSLVTDPEVLLLDEPFGALDIYTRHEMQKLLMDLFYKLSNTNNKTTFIMVTHDMEEATLLGDEIHIMRANPGKVVERIISDLPWDRTVSYKSEPKFKEAVLSLNESMLRWAKI
jgi:NitT/TauT family transport system ATP-binding protein